MWLPARLPPDLIVAVACFLSDGFLYPVPVRCYLSGVQGYYTPVPCSVNGAKKRVVATVYKGALQRKNEDKGKNKDAKRLETVGTTMQAENMW